ncbi:hypothetical protein yc1106_09862 [Curvularia clavata]|uniref:Uncharacterized protein n=1 Tax=Curvularia clavata TaxID=95742 RepID=A0A9Q8ZKY4_CURCL|nr:hypothetical protein yc1106_09862 [Curvularia clavata]
MASHDGTIADEGRNLPHDPVFAAQLAAELNAFLRSPQVDCGTYMVANTLPGPFEAPYPPRPEWEDVAKEAEMAQTTTSVPEAPAPTPGQPQAKTTVAKVTAPAPAGVSKKARRPRAVQAPAPTSSPLGAASTIDEINVTENNYRPKLDESLIPPAEAKVRSKHYGAYFGEFTSSEAARRHRHRSRVGAKRAADTQRVKKFGRAFWVRRLYEAMVDVSEISDGKDSIHRQRITALQAFEPLDLEAAAHHIFDKAVQVHEDGWCRPLLYRKHAVRGKNSDKAADSLELRLSLICELLRTKKAMVDDAVRGGVTLALLVDNPTGRGATKSSNDVGNEKKGRRLKVAKELEAKGRADEEDGDSPEAQA